MVTVYRVTTVFTVSGTVDDYAEGTTRRVNLKASFATAAGVQVYQVTLIFQSARRRLDDAANGRKLQTGGVSVEASIDTSSSTESATAAANLGTALQDSDSATTSLGEPVIGTPSTPVEETTVDVRAAPSPPPPSPPPLTF